MEKKTITEQSCLIGDFRFESEYFNYSIHNFTTLEFQSLNEVEKKNLVYRYLLELIQNTKIPCFLLSAVIDFLQTVHAKGVLQGTLHFSSFELWLNHYSGLSIEENRKIRGKITGKWIAREDFQGLFPLGMGKVFHGSHFVCAHASPDIDTTVASFWGWMDAFAARISEGLHIWNIPGGSPPKQIVKIFERFFGEGVIQVLSQGANTLTIRAMDIMTPYRGETIDKTQESLGLRADYEEIRELLENQSQVLIVSSEEGLGECPIGWIQSVHLNRSYLGTVSLRDFCNREETKIPSYLDIISVVDHHRSVLKTSVPPVCLIADVQSSNVLVAEQSFLIQDQYINDSEYFIHPLRLYIEYFCLTVAILDDTDLLTKVTPRDVNCMAELVNRMKSLVINKKTSVISLNDFTRGPAFANGAAERLLQEPELYSIYQKIYLIKEQEIEENIHSCLNGDGHAFFADTKTQGSCSRVGQTKIFANNFSVLHQKRENLIKKWIEHNYSFNEARPECDLFIHMISTIPGAEEMYQGLGREYSHFDELWFWTPSTEEATDHLHHFLHGFRTNPELVGNSLQLELFSNSNKQAEEAFIKFLATDLLEKIIKVDTNPTDQKPIAILRFKAGTINSRKSSIAPYVPH